MQVLPSLRETTIRKSWLWGSFAVFIALTTFLARHHVMWRDEGRALSIAIRTSSWRELFGALHGEGHPILWYAVLRVAHSIFDTPYVLPAAALLIAAAAAWLVLRYAPFPVWARLSIVFGAFLAYEYSVVARNYGIGVLLMICAAIAFSSRAGRPLWLGVALALLANTSVHAALAAIVLTGVWILDITDPERRPGLYSSRTIAALVVAIAGIAFAILSSRPPADMSYAFSLGHITPGKILASVLLDPGKAMPDLTAAMEIPWRRIHLDAELAARVLGNAAILGALWSLRRNRAALAALIVAVLGFEVIFGAVYIGSLRHQGILAFLIIALVWIAVTDARPSERDARSRRLSLGLLPLLLTQSLALPFMARRQFERPASSSKAFADLIRSTPNLDSAIIAGEPDSFMEAMSYYVPNRVFIPRQRDFGYRVYFDSGRRRRLELNLGELVSTADSLSAAYCTPVLLAIGYPAFRTDSAGQAYPGYRGAVFRWTPAEHSKLLDRGRLLATFEGSLTSEDFQVFEIDPQSRACVPRR